MNYIRVVVFLLLCIYVTNANKSCWYEPLVPLPCTGNLTGNLAFPIWGNPLVAYESEFIREAVRYRYYPNLSITATHPIGYHLTISNLFCLNDTHRVALKSALGTFRWQPMTGIIISTPCCERNGWLEVCVNSAGGMRLRMFWEALAHHLISKGVPIALALDEYQPPFHVTIGEFLPAPYDLDLEGLRLRNLIPLPPLELFYFGMDLYWANVK